MARVLGAVLAGGMASRFGSDKALALWHGRTLLDWTRDALAGHVEAIVMCGRTGGLPDRPAGGLGPLAGINAALHHGRAAGFDSVLTVPCDTPTIGAGLLERLREAESAAYADDIPVIGYWPCRLTDDLDVHLRGADRSMRGWIRRIGAHAIPLDHALPNINFVEDLLSLSAPDRPEG